VIKLLVKALKSTGLLSKILPYIFRAWAEGGLGKPAQKLYWFAAGYKTVTGAVIMALGTGLEAVAAAYPDFVWAPAAARAVFWVGAFLSSVGLVDGGVRSRWPDGTPITREEKGLPPKRVK